MSTGRTIAILAEKKSPLLKVIQKALKELHKKYYQKSGGPPKVYKKGRFGKDSEAEEVYCFCAWYFPDGHDIDYFGAEEVFGNRYEKYKKKYKMFLAMGGSNTTFRDRETGEESNYPIFHFKKIMEKIKESGLENDLRLICLTDSGGEHHRTYPKKIRSKWNGKFL